MTIQSDVVSPWPGIVSVAVVPPDLLAAVMRSAREGRNPATGEPLAIPEQRVVKFSPGSSLKDKVAGS